MGTIDFILDQELRDKLAERVEVLDKVKELLLIPAVSMVTAQDIADYYEVDKNTIRVCYQRNRAEFLEDGAQIMRLADLKANFLLLESGKEGAKFDIGNGQTLSVSNRGIFMFSKRAVLRFGMLLRDSKVAKEVRTQLLNITELPSDKQKTEAIEDEQNIINQIGQAYASGNFDEFCRATMQYNAFKQRHIDKLTNDNKALAADILHWSNRNSLNKAVRVAACEMRMSFGHVWNILYDELLYRHGICLKRRGKPPLVQHIRDDEWPKVQKSLCAICEAHNVNPSEVAEKARMTISEEV